MASSAQCLRVRTAHTPTWENPSYAGCPVLSRKTQHCKVLLEGVPSSAAQAKVTPPAPAHILLHLLVRRPQSSEGCRPSLHSLPSQVAPRWPRVSVFHFTTSALSLHPLICRSEGRGSRPEDATTAPAPRRVYCHHGNLPQALGGAWGGAWSGPPGGCLGVPRSAPGLADSGRNPGSGSACALGLARGSAGKPGSRAFLSPRWRDERPVTDIGF